MYLVKQIEPCKFLWSLNIGRFSALVILLDSLNAFWTRLLKKHFIVRVTKTWADPRFETDGVFRAKADVTLCTFLIFKQHTHKPHLNWDYTKREKEAPPPLSKPPPPILLTWNDYGGPMGPFQAGEMVVVGNFLFSCPSYLKGKKWGVPFTKLKRVMYGSALEYTY